MSHLEKVRSQINDLQRRGYPPWKIEIHTTAGALRKIVASLRRETPERTHFADINGSRFVRIPGVLNVSYAIVPYMDVDFELDGRMKIVDADTRILDLCMILVGGKTVQFTPLDVERLPKGRANIVARVESISL